MPGSSRGGEANGAMKGTEIPSHPFILPDEVHQTPGISKRLSATCAIRIHPPAASHAVTHRTPCWRALAPKNPPLNADAVLFTAERDPPATDLPAARIAPAPMVLPSGQRLLAMQPQDHGKKSPCPFPYRYREGKNQDNLKDRSTTRGDSGTCRIAGSS